ncbi:hypothetical protein TWF718_001937 [Orbilia javanica]|uniref:Uncharacterized protein n=1 Tax=Orbilia javanica TaxID=47235 RepID=A0AAN8RHQ4_9PEZI
MNLTKGKLFPLLLALTTVSITVNASTCIEIPGDDLVPGECTIRVIWQKITHHSKDPENGQIKIRDRVAAEIFDTAGVRASEKSLNDFQSCRGDAGQECRIDSKLHDQMLLSPQHGREYMQFRYGEMGWHTDPNPLEGPKYLGDDVSDKRPWCGVYSDWVRVLGDGPGGKYTNDSDIASIEARAIECQFICGYLNIFPEDYKPCEQGPSLKPKTVTRTESIVGTTVVTVTHTSNRVVVREVYRTITSVKIQASHVETTTVTKSVPVPVPIATGPTAMPPIATDHTATSIPPSNLLKQKLPERSIPTAGSGKGKRKAEFRYL